ncbi:GPI inositol-deacylase-like [Dendronephthya gigantea]|uniref:GPI inositol-deacylase-like n=1 Tax=Dendronephthya gigantea TaxID=151771 RepID=UPI00106AC836|nr:GPI inositol-deacylase-like [Dendronephthya gigantea]
MVNQGRVSVCVIGLCVTTIVVLFISARKAFFDQEENGCEMTYMFEYPEYIRVKLKKQISEKYPRYGLYLYGEGSYAQEQKRVFEPKGIPVLFIPGNAGSYRQVRSLASIALRKAERLAHHFNYFTVDFDEDFSGLFGGVLMDQVNFVHSCLRHIIREYKGNKSGPESVILIGHSMGGMIARALFTLENFNSKFVSIIITLGTPQTTPVIPFDKHLGLFYTTVNKLWKNNPKFANMSVISLAGGARDILVPARHCLSPHNVHMNLQYSAVTTSIPNVWITIDHQALCWCKQLILVINRALFALIDEKHSRIATDRKKQVRVLRKYFGIFDKNEEILPQSELQTSLKTTYNATGLWNSFEHIPLPGTFLIPIETSSNDGQFIALSNSPGDISMTSCQNEEVERCSAGEMISFQALPKASSAKPGFFHLPNLMNISSIRVTSSQDKANLAAQFLPRSHTNKLFNEFGVFSGVQRFWSPTYLFLNISLPMIRNCFDVYLITVKKISCKGNGDGLLAGRIHSPWSIEDVYARPEETTEFSILLKIQVPQTTTILKSSQLHIWKTDECSLEVTVEYQFFQTFGRILVMYAPLIIQWIYSWIMIIFIIQLRQVSRDGAILSVLSTITSDSFSLFIPLIISLFNELFMKSLIRSLGWSGTICQGCVIDGPVLYDWLLPSCFVILAAFAIFLTTYLLLEIILSFSAWLFTLCLSKIFQLYTRTSTPIKLALYACFGLVLFCFVCLCSSIAMYFLMVVSFVHCFKTTVKSRALIPTGGMENLLASTLNSSKLVLVLLLLISLQTMPSFLVWLKVLRTSWFLPSDPFRIIVIMLIPTVVCCLEMNIRKPSRYVWCIVLGIWYVGFLLFSLAALPFIAACILLAVDFFIFEKHSKNKKN